MGGGKRKKRMRSVRAGSRKAAPNAKSARTGDIRDFFGMLAGKTKKAATIEEMNEAAAAGWAEGGLAGLTCAGHAQRLRSMKDFRLDSDPGRTRRFEPSSKVSSFKRKPL
jgi:hypothetical protein